jgi:myo-inositol-1(or 4)-monophosphatase
MTPERNVRIQAAQQAVLGQTDRLHHDFGRVESRWKPDGTRVTATDVAISEGIVAELSRHFPEDQFLSEELAGTKDPIPVASRFSWILDPIDGTNNFAFGIPHCAIALALVEHGVPVYGVVYDFSRRSLIVGGPGHGVMDGGRLVRVSSAPLTPSSLVGLHSPTDKTQLAMASGVMSEFKIRGLGSATLHLAYAATGLLDGCVDFNVKIWDLAAAIPLMQAAGGEVHFLNGEQIPIRTFDLRMKSITYLAGGPEICTRLRRLLGAADRAGS